MTSANGHPTIKTYSGYTLNFLAPKPGMIFVDDIAQGLSQVCRFAAQSSEFYSVAQHSVLVSRLVPQKYARWGLMHDAAEAFMGDMARPLKRLIPQYKELEIRLMKAIAERFDLPWPQPDCVKEADQVALALEGSKFMAGREDEYGISTLGKQIGMAVNAVFSATPREGRTMFLDRYFDLWKKKRKRLAKV